MERYTPNQESAHDKNYTGFKTAESQVEQILKEIEKVFLTAPNKEEAEKIILGKWAPKMEEALDSSKIALAKWLVSVRGVVE